MDKNSLLLSFYEGRTINQDAFSAYFSPNGSSKTEYTHEVLDKYDSVAYELMATIEDDIVIGVSVFKSEDHFVGHGRPVTIEKSLTASEWKYAYQVFDECFPDQSENEVIEVIQNALQKGVSYSGYTIRKELKNDLLFETDDNNTTKLPKKRISQAIHYSHRNLDILLKPETTKNFSSCLGKTPYEPLFAVLSVVNAEAYPNYASLLAKYRFEELIRAIEAGSVELCTLYEDVLKDPNCSISTIGNAVSQAGNSDIVAGFFKHVPDSSCVLNNTLYAAINNNDFETVNCILKKHLFDYSEDSRSYHSPMGAAKNHPTFIPLLLEYGFELWNDEYLSTLTLDKIKDSLQFNVHLGETVIVRILSEKRYDILQIIEESVPKYCAGGILLSAYIIGKDFDRFKKGVEKGWFSNESSLFEKAYEAGESWADLLIQNGYDVNQENGKELSNACRELKVDFAIYLLKNGADPYLRGEYSSTDFEYAAGYHGYLNDEQENDQERLCKYLLDIGVDPIMESTRTPSIFTYLMNLSSEFKLYLVDWLGKHNRINAYECKDDRNISEHSLLYSVLDPFSRDKYDSTVLKKMLDYGAKVDVSADSEDTLFIQACAVCDVEELKLFVNHGANIKELDKRKHTNGLYDAVWHKRPKEVIEYLISLGLDVNNAKPESRVKTSSYYGTENVYPAESVLDIALEKRDPETIELLKAHGAKTAAEMTQEA